MKCKIRLGEKRLQEVTQFKHGRTILCKDRSMEGEMRKKTVKGRQIVGELESYEVRAWG